MKKRKKTIFELEDEKIHQEIPEFRRMCRCGRRIPCLPCTAQSLRFSRSPRNPAKDCPIWDHWKKNPKNALNNKKTKKTEKNPKNATKNPIWKLKKRTDVPVNNFVLVQILQAQHNARRVKARSNLGKDLCVYMHLPKCKRDYFIHLCYQLIDWCV